MGTPAKPNDLLHRYILRRGAARKVGQRLLRLVRDGNRDPIRDLHRLLPDAKVIFDVGANIGYVANDFHRAWPTARIYCFEPTEQTYGRLVENLADISQIECINSAVSDVDGTARFLVDNRTLGGGANSLLDHSSEFTLNAPKRAHYEPVEVPTLRLDTFCKDRGIDHIDFLKLDIEGAEPLALRGAADLLSSSSVDAILTEVRLVPGYEKGVLMHELEAQLADSGYRVFNIYRFAESGIRQGMWGDAAFLGPAFRRRLIDQYGAAACGFVD